MLDGIMAGTMGAQEFYDFVNADGPPADDAIRADIETAIDTFDLVLTEYVDNEVSREADYGFAQATESLHSGDAVMFFHGDWAKGYLVSVGWTAGVDFGVSGPPGASDLFVYGADMFAMPVSAQHPNNARNFLSVLASKEAQVAFNRFKGSTPMRMDARDELDEPGKLALDNLIEAKVLMKGHPNDDWDAAIEAYVADGDKAALLEVYLTADP
jgi:glucose/mannose transport system substrate-binding protein